MKRYIALTLILLILIVNTGCAGSSASTQSDAAPSAQGDAAPAAETPDTTAAPEPSAPVIDGTPVYFTARNHPMALMDDDVTLMNANYYEITLSDADAARFPRLNEALSGITAGYASAQTETLRESAEDIASMFSEGWEYACECDMTPDFIRADGTAFTFVMMHYSYLGGAHGETAYSSVNLDPETGDAIPLTAVLTRTEGFAQVIYDELLKQNDDLPEYFKEMPSDGESLLEYIKTQLAAPADNFGWAIGSDGLYFYFNDYDMGSYAAGARQAVVYYADYPDYFAEKYQSTAAAADINAQVTTLDAAEAEYILYTNEALIK